jgi:hypothetical protein
LLDQNFDCIAFERDSLISKSERLVRKHDESGDQTRSLRHFKFEFQNALIAFTIQDFKVQVLERLDRRDDRTLFEQS